MMKRLDREIVAIPKEKLTEYLLNETHPTGKFKSRLFREFGFTSENAGLLEKQLYELISNNDIQETIDTQFGTKYIVDGKIYSQDHRPLVIRTVWIKNINEVEIRFVTAYPL